ncbi:MAG TPA: DNA-processing protein DprA [Pseudogracilibacillus sp.]|nr:DNA-processing protein DprA [Pseudogracilibacillus sp.]
MKTKRDRLLYLHYLPSMTRRYLYKIKKTDPEWQHIFSHTPQELSTLLQLPIHKAVTLYKEIQNTTYYLSQLQHNLRRMKTVTIYDKIYPDILKNIPDSPLILYVLGDTSLLNQQKSISVIGTRKPSSEAFSKLQHIVAPLLEDEWSVVSGLAYGIDSMAHRLTLKADRKTIAVLGSGFFHIYPKPHLALCKEIAKHGLVLSEYPPYKRPQKYFFPERNRIISGLSQATLVIEAMERSGTLITVDQALDQGKEVYAIPGSPLMPQTKGCLRMIQDGAKAVIDSTDILEDWTSFSVKNR